VSQFLRALGCKFVEPINELGIAPAFVAGHAQHIELADEIAEYDCGRRGAWRRSSHRGAVGARREQEWGLDYDQVHFAK
jgi:hypothetical protein